MTNEQVWADRVREWEASGQSKADFSRGKGYTASGLSYWVKRLASKATTKSPKAVTKVHLARVLRGREPNEDRALASPSVTRRSGSEKAEVVVELVAIRAAVPGGLVDSNLEAVVASLLRGWNGGRS